jgi:hypothetical protein
MKPKYSEKTCSSPAMPTTNPTCPDEGSNAGHRSVNPVTNSLCYGTALSLLDTLANMWPIVPAPYATYEYRWWWNVEQSVEWLTGKSKYSQKTCPSAILSTTNSTWPDTGLNTASRGRKPATNHQSYGTASAYVLENIISQQWLRWHLLSCKFKLGHSVKINSC